MVAPGAGPGLGSAEPGPASRPWLSDAETGAESLLDPYRGPSRLRARLPAGLEARRPARPREAPGRSLPSSPGPGSRGETPHFRVPPAPPARRPTPGRSCRRSETPTRAGSLLPRWVLTVLKLSAKS